MTDSGRLPRPKRCSSTALHNATATSPAPNRSPPFFVSPLCAFRAFPVHSRRDFARREESDGLALLRTNLGKFHNAQTSVGAAPGAWTMVRASSRSKGEITGLTSGSLVWVQVQAMDPNSMVSAWSNAVP